MIGMVPDYAHAPSYLQQRRHVTGTDREVLFEGVMAGAERWITVEPAGVVRASVLGLRGRSWQMLLLRS